MRYTQSGDSGGVNGLKSCGLAALAISMAGVSAAQGAVVGDYNPDTLAAGTSPQSVTTLNDSSGSNNNLTNPSGNVPQLFGPTTINRDTVFNNRNYIAYNGGALQTASALYTGANPRSVAAVYDTPAFVAGTNFNATAAGQAPQSTAGTGGTWFAIESRQNNVTGNPYLVNYGPDVSSHNLPVAGQLTFAVATYDGTNETLYYAYGPTGTVSSQSVPTTLNTASSPFQVGASFDGNSPIDVGQVTVYNSALSSADATSLIQSLQTSYAAPEPASLSLLGLGVVGLLARRRRA